jgi:hypothetical protein
MEKIYSVETGKTTWCLDSAWQKTIYVVGLVFVGYFFCCFSIGFISGVISAF